MKMNRDDLVSLTTGYPTDWHILEEREKTHGDFKSNSELSQAFKFLFRNQPSYLTMDVRQKEALDMIAGKLGRILSGNAKFKDHWLDGSGYFLLGMKACDDDR